MPRLGMSEGIYQLLQYVFIVLWLIKQGYVFMVWYLVKHRDDFNFTFSYIYKLYNLNNHCIASPLRHRTAVKKCEKYLHI